jgi:hypothetical protein
MADNENEQWKTLLKSNRRVQMNDNTCDIIVNMLNIQNIHQLIERTTESQAKSISESIKSAARALPSESRTPSFSINVNIPNDAVADDARRAEIIQAALDQAAALETARATRARTSAMGTTPYVSPESATMYHAVWYWATLQARMGRQVTSNNTVCSPDALRKTIARIEYENDIGKEISSVKPPGTLKSLNKFREWWETWTVYMRSKRGAARIPLSYVFRPEETVTAEMRDKTYSTSDEEYCALFRLDGTYYQVDNKTVFHDLNALLVGGPLESIIKKYEKREDGRAATLAVLQYANGDDAKMARTNQAMKIIDSTTFHRRSTNFTLDDFFARLRKNYAILESNGEPLQESMKVSQALGKIQDKNLEVAKGIFMSQMTSSTTFEQMVNTFKTIAAASYTNATTNDRSISEIRRDEEKKKASSDKKTVKDSEVHAGTYSPSAWKQLTSKQQQWVSKTPELSPERPELKTTYRDRPLSSYRPSKSQTFSQ